MFNTDEYAWKDIQVRFQGVKLATIMKVMYEVDTVQTPGFGSGSIARFIATGNTTVSGELEIMQSELLKMIRAVRVATGNINAKLTELPGLDLQVTYGNGLTATTDNIIGVKFSKYTRSMEQGDPFMKVALPFLAIDVEDDV